MRDSSMSFPASLTTEELRFKAMFEKMRSLRRAIAGNKATSSTSREEHPKPGEKRISKRSIEEAEVATEEVKRKVMSGGLTINKVQERQTFKRPKVLERRRDSDALGTMSSPSPTSLSQPPKFDDETIFAKSDTPTTSQRKPTTTNAKADGQRRLYDSFVTGGSLHDDGDAEEGGDGERKQLPPTRGSTLYVRSYDLCEDPLRKAFEKYGKICRIEIADRQKSAFITFDVLESADKALKEVSYPDLHIYRFQMDGNMVNGITLRVNFARRQTNSLTPAPSNNNRAPPASTNRPQPPPPVQQQQPQPIAQSAWSDATRRVSSSSDDDSGAGAGQQRKRENSRSLITYDDDDTFS